ncbi:barstar family protein [Arenimonas sp. MALMAid1274]|uniref:barstar family protein n=1 Tax=Arenimonas sp. MALMAid1274 TaxID=3411630 RepID=UPI003BA21795
MSVPPLHALLLDADQSGAFYLTAADLPALQDAATDSGLHLVTMDLADCRDKRALLQQFADAFAFPPDIGHTWDALADALGDLSWLPAEGYVLTLSNLDALRDAAPDELASLVSVLEDCSLQWRELGRPFWTFLALADDEFSQMPV